MAVNYNIVITDVNCTTSTSGTVVTGTIEIDLDQSFDIVEVHVTPQTGTASSGTANVTVDPVGLVLTKGG